MEDNIEDYNNHLTISGNHNSIGTTEASIITLIERPEVIVNHTEEHIGMYKRIRKALKNINQWHGN